MGSDNHFQCDRCSLEVQTSGPWPFYRDDQGRPLLGDPERIPEEAFRKGIRGLLAKVFCLDCCSSTTVILAEREEPGSPAASGPPTIRSASGAANSANVHWPPRCPYCGGERLLLEPELDREVPCPACGQGHLHGRATGNRGGFQA